MAGFSNRELVSKANEVVPMLMVCNHIGMDTQVYGHNSKMYCPFGHITHVDRGESKAFRLYDETNSAWCFACSEYFTPVSLYVAATDVSKEEAAEVLLELVGWRDETYEESWDRVTQEEQKVDHRTLLSTLERYCARLDEDWILNRMNEPFKEAMIKSATLLRRVQTEEQAMRWYDASRAYLRKVIHDSK